jgi:CRP/FNR family transcriptional regulator, cyclic AMP receptor protein
MSDPVCGSLTLCARLKGAPKGNVVTTQHKHSYSPHDVLVAASIGATIMRFRKDQPLFAQGDAADSLFYIQEGRVKISIVSEHGKEAVIAILEPGSFCGEGCLAGQPLRLASAVAMIDCVAARMEKAAANRSLHKEGEFSELLMVHLLSRNIRVEADLVDQLFNSTEKRLARLLLLLANYGKEGRPEPILPPISQETLAEMIGTSRSRVSIFMNKFREMGFIEYNGNLKVHSSLLSVVLHETPAD